MTLNEITYSILGQVRPVLTSDSNLTPQHVKNDVIAERSDLIKKHMEGRFTFHDVFTQDLGCVPLEIADSADCCIETDCTILRTAVEIPQEISLTRVGPINKTKKRFTLVPFETIDYVGNGRFNKDSVFAFVLNNRVYLKSNNHNISLLEYINIRGVFEDPRTVQPFNNCGIEVPCYSDDEPFPMPKWMEVHIREKLITSYLRSEQVPKDLNNDSKDQKTDAA